MKIVSNGHNIQIIKRIRGKDEKQPAIKNISKLKI